MTTDRQTLTSGASDSQDQSDILTDKDETALVNPKDDILLDEKLSAFEDLENEPAEFARGEIDVVEQMDRAARAMEDAVNKKQLHPEGHIPREI